MLVMTIAVKTLLYGGFLAVFWIGSLPFFDGLPLKMDYYLPFVLVVTFWLYSKGFTECTQSIKKLLVSLRFDLGILIIVGFWTTLRLLHHPLTVLLSSKDDRSFIEGMLVDWLSASTLPKVESILFILPAERLWIIFPMVMSLGLYWLCGIWRSHRINVRLRNILLTGAMFRVGMPTWFRNYVKLVKTRACETRSKWDAIGYRPSMLFTDEPLNDRCKDLLGFSSQAERFADNVYNNGAPESLIFCLDAAWGSGKTTFLQFCDEFWAKKYKENVIVYWFKPLQFSNREQLLDNLLCGLAQKIGNHIYAPELQSIFSQSAKFFDRAEASLSFGPIVLRIPLSSDRNMDSTLFKLKSALKSLGKKIIVIIDDLDRLQRTEANNILFGIRSALDLPYVSYILSYSSSNIAARDEGCAKKSIDDTQTQDRLFAQHDHLIEFMEKFATIKQTLLISKKMVKQYLKVLQESLDPLIQNKTLSKTLLDGMRNLIDDQDIDLFNYFLSNIRKIKRLASTIVSLEMNRKDDVDFEDYDFEGRDLMLLLLLYLNFPETFREIYVCETKEDFGTFSLVTEYDSKFPKTPKTQNRSVNSKEHGYTNSDEFKKIKENKSKAQRILLEKLFDVQKRYVDNRYKAGAEDLGLRGKENELREFSESARKTYACFNGGGMSGKNLVEYLAFIAHGQLPGETGESPQFSRALVPPTPAVPVDTSVSAIQQPTHDPTKQHSFYVRKVQKYLDGTSLDIISEELNQYTQNIDVPHDEFWRTLAKHPSDDFSIDQATEIIDFLVDHLPDYSMLDSSDNEDSLGSNLGVRHTLMYRLLGILNAIGWVDDEDKHWENDRDHILTIAHHIFGEHEYAGKGILARLLNKNRGVLGLMDTMGFRLSCCHNRGGRLYNLYHALGYHANSDAPTSGNITELAIGEMREMSQFIFKVFKEEYIDKKRNIFDEIDTLAMEDMTGSELWHKLLHKRFSEEKLRRKLLYTRNFLTEFIPFQLGNKDTSSGIGCGYYNPTGTDDTQEISDHMNTYFFDVCFDGYNKEKDYEYFLRHLMNRNSATVSGKKIVVEPAAKDFTVLLNRERLIEFWNSHREEIKKRKFEESDTSIETSIGTLTYKDCLPKIYEILDKMI